MQCDLRHMGIPLAEVAALVQKECRTVRDRAMRIARSGYYQWPVGPRHRTCQLSLPVSLALTGPVNVLAIEARGCGELESSAAIVPG